MTTTGFRTFVLAAGMMTLAPFAALRAAEPPKLEFNIPAQRMTDSLNAIAQKSNLRIVYFSADTVGLSAPAVSGELTAEAALKKVLANSGLQYLFKDEKTVQIRLIGSGESERRSQNTQLAPRAASLEIAMVQTQPARSSSVEGVERGAAAGQQGEDSRGVPEILVKGARSLNTDIKRTEDDMQPYLVFDRAMIESSGAADLQDFLKNRLTMGTSSVSESQTPAAVLGNASTINLRGLGTTETLVLIDGRRLPAYSSYAMARQPDLNGIPLSAIERIEVLPGTASGIYGGGATGGAINVIMRRDYTGVETKVTYSNAFDTDVARRRVELSGGFNFGPRTNLLVSASYSDAEALLTQDRDYQMNMRRFVYANSRATFLGVPAPLLGATTNIRGVNGVTLTLKGSNLSLGSANTYVPYNYAGPASDGGASFLANAGKYNIDLADNAAYGAGQGKRLAITNAPKVQSGAATLRHEFTPNLSVFGEFSVSKNAGTFVRSGLFSNITVPGSAPGNPFNQNIRVTFPSAGTDSQDDSSLSTYRVAGGAIAKLGSWTAGLDYTQGRTRLKSVMIGRAYADGTAAAIGSGALQIFRDLNVYPQDFTPYIMPRIAMTPSDTTLQDVSLRLSGPTPDFLALPGGVPKLSLLLEHRSQEFGEQFRSYPTRLNPLRVEWWRYAERVEDVNSLYVEALIPLISASNHVPGIHSLELQLAARHDRYDTMGALSTMTINTPPAGPAAEFFQKLDSTDPTLALRYKPVEDVMLRVSYATGFLPPSGDLLVDPGVIPYDGLWTYDPLRGYEEVEDIFFLGTGAGQDLKPEQSQTWSAGVVLTPRFIEGLRVSVDWVAIRKTDNIDYVLTYTDEDFATEPYVPGLVLRGPRASNDTYPVGPVIGFNAGPFNVGKVDMTAFDFAVDYAFDTPAGQFDFVLGATRLVSLETQFTPNAPLVQYAGVGSAASLIYDLDAGGLKWKANTTLTWRRSNWTLGWSTRYFDRYYLNTAHTFSAAQNSSMVPSQIYNDLFGTYGFSGGGLANFLPGQSEIQFGINNFLNKAPPLDAVGLGSSAPGYSLYGDPRQANYYLGFKTNFGR